MTDKTTDVITDSVIKDSDLMAYFDGELDEADIEALEAALEEQEEASIKLADLALVRDVIRDQVDEDTRADDIADAVMAKLEAEDADDELPLQKGPAVVAPANDNSSTLWKLSAAAAAVAAGLFVWGNSAPDEPTALAPTQATVAAPVEAAQPAPETMGEMADAAPEAGGNAEDEDAVEIAQLDFGDEEHTGSIFKVENENTGVQTAVVWVTETGDDEE